MSVGIKVGPNIGEVGTADLLNAFFSTVAGVLEHGRSGSRFPIVSGDFCDGQVTAKRTGSALAELHAIRDEFARRPASVLIWDLDDRSAQPPGARRTVDGRAPGSRFRHEYRARPRRSAARGVFARVGTKAARRHRDASRTLARPAKPPATFARTSRRRLPRPPFTWRNGCRGIMASAR
ncbi:immunity 70 family protein [Tahibacter caeni]|uniref:immunity 70 family protein n=1 Tax=Tahibacter caeni TaxID=1453545 RepID=UPI002148D62F|nr:immunity 70 family protein [Tahibacter caeni]